MAEAGHNSTGANNLCIVVQQETLKDTHCPPLVSMWALHTWIYIPHTYVHPPMENQALVFTLL